MRVVSIGEMEFGEQETIQCVVLEGTAEELRVFGPFFAKQLAVQSTEGRVELVHRERAMENGE